MTRSLDTATTSENRSWVYATLTVLDGDRRLKPAQVGPNELCFTEPPRLTGGELEVILRNGDLEQRHVAIVLPHDSDATRIPIELLAPR